MSFLFVLHMEGYSDDFQHGGIVTSTNTDLSSFYQFSAVFLYNLEYHTTPRNDFTAEESDFCRF